ncbi:MAG TPA: ATP-binding protein [Candidatus Solibacter sp.]|jgi:signal transduction histidine kinase|nr:ATP-binding protein [Candidatus Solibacter sp.]
MTKLSVRARLTAVYAGLFMLIGAGLLVLNYTLLDHYLPNAPSQSAIAHAGLSTTQDSSGSVTVVGPGPDAGSGQFFQALQINTNDLRDATLHQLLVQSSLALVLMGVVAAFLGWLIAGRVVSPIKAITAQARRLSERNLHERIDLDGPDDEIKDLADTFDAMLARLDSAFDSQKSFVANASHELRTPLAITRAAVEVQVQRQRPSEAQWRAMSDQVLSATERSDRLIGSLLLLARIERGSLLRESVDLARLVSAAVDEVRPMAAAAGVRLESSAEAASVLGDPDLLRRLVGNLLENAVRYNVDGGWLTATLTRDDAQAVITVANSGPVLSPQMATEIFEPFKRGATPRTRSAEGSGLGLSIVATIASAHGGQVHALPLQDGGLEVSVTLPALS